MKRTALFLVLLGLIVWGQELSLAATRVPSFPARGSYTKTTSTANDTVTIVPVQRVRSLAVVTDNNAIQVLVYPEIGRGVSGSAYSVNHVTSEEVWSSPGGPVDSVRVVAPTSGTVYRVWVGP